MKSLVSAVHKGSAFERRALSLLHHDLSMFLHRVGGRSDGGIDLQGWWWLPLNLRSESSRMTISHRNRIRVLGQCKAERKKIGPKYIREMEGVLHRFSQEDTPSIALFISESPFSKETLLELIHRASHFSCYIYLLKMHRKTLRELNLPCLQLGP